MIYQDIPNFNQRCDAHPDHQDRIIGHADIQLRLHEEIADLRHFIELRLLNEKHTYLSNKESNT